MPKCRQWDLARRARQAVWRGRVKLRRKWKMLSLAWLLVTLRDSQTSSSCLDFHWRVRCANNSTIIKTSISSADRRGDIDATENAMQLQKKRMHFCSLSLSSPPPLSPQLNLLVTNVMHSGKYATYCDCGFKQNRIANT